MKQNFFRFPHTPHLAWLGSGTPRDDKVLSPAEAQSLLAGDVVIEEKLDGANIGFSLNASGALQAQNRGQYLSDPPTGQFARLPAWLAQHGDVLLAALEPPLMLFGEWCAARHSLDYVALPDWFLLFDVYDRDAGRFWSTTQRDQLAGLVRISTVPRIASGHYTLPELRQFMQDTPSRYRAGLPPEGIVIRRDVGDWNAARAKLVRPEFVQAIDEHWRRRAIEWNLVSFGAHPHDGVA